MSAIRKRDAQTQHFASREAELEHLYQRLQLIQGDRAEAEAKFKAQAAAVTQRVNDLEAEKRAERTLKDIDPDERAALLAALKAGG